jgi:hypothetical protein
MAIDKNTTEMLAQARRFAEMGSIECMRYSITIAKEHSEMSGCDISLGIEKIEGLGYDNAIQLELNSARNFARERKTLPMDASLFLARTYAQFRNRDLSEEIEAIRNLA